MGLIRVSVCKSDRQNFINKCWWRRMASQLRPTDVPSNRTLAPLWRAAEWLWRHLVNADKTYYQLKHQPPSWFFKSQVTGTTELDSLACLRYTAGDGDAAWDDVSVSTTASAADPGERAEWRSGRRHLGDGGQVGGRCVNAEWTADWRWPSSDRRYSAAQPSCVCGH